MRLETPPPTPTSGKAPRARAAYQPRRSGWVPPLRLARLPRVQRHLLLPVRLIARLTLQPLHLCPSSHPSVARTSGGSIDFRAVLAAERARCARAAARSAEHMAAPIAFAQRGHVAFLARPSHCLPPAANVSTRNGEGSVAGDLHDRLSPGTHSTMQKSFLATHELWDSRVVRRTRGVCAASPDPATPTGAPRYGSERS